MIVNNNSNNSDSCYIMVIAIRPFGYPAKLLIEHGDAAMIGKTS